MAQNGGIPQYDTDKQKDGGLFNKKLYKRGDLTELEIALTKHEIKNRDGKNPLHFIAEQMSEVNELIIDLLLRKCGNSLLSDAAEDGNTPCHLAVIYCKPKILKILLKHGAWQLTCQDEVGNNPFHELMIAFESCEDEKGWAKCLTILMDFDKNTDEFDHVQAGINQVNKKGYTPVHLAGRNLCSKGMAEFLQYYWERDPTKGSVKRPSLLHYMCGLNYYRLTDDDKETGCGRLKLFLDVLKHLQQNNFSSAFNSRFKELTPLENAIVNLQPAVVKHLLQCKELEQTKNDGVQWNPLGLAAMNGGSKEARECFHLIIKSAEKRETFSTEVYESRDESEPTVLKHVLEYCGQEEIELLLKSTLDKDGQLRQKQLGEAKRSAFVQEILIRLSVWYGEKEKTHDPTKNSIPSKGQTSKAGTISRKKTIEFDVGSITGQYEKFNGPETLYLVESLHNWGYKDRKLVLGNPALKYFVREKFIRLRTFMIMALIMQFAWLTVMGILCFQFWDGRQEISILKYVALAYVACSTLFETYEVFRLKSLYLFQFSNIAQWMRNGILSAAIIIHQDSKEEGQALFSIGLLVAAIVSMRHLRNLSEGIGQSVDIFFQIVKIVLSVFLGCSLLWLSFYAGWMILFAGATFRENPLPSLNRTGAIPFITTMIMMTGGIDTNEIADALDPEMSEVLPFTIAVRSIFFCMFLICIVFAFFNQLIGVALAEVQEMRERATIQRIAWKIEYAFLVETFVYGLCKLPCFPFKFDRFCVASEINPKRMMTKVAISTPILEDKLPALVNHIPGIERFTVEDNAELFRFAAENQDLYLNYIIE